MWGWVCAGMKILERSAASSLRTQARTFSLGQRRATRRATDEMGQDANLKDLRVCSIGNAGTQAGSKDGASHINLYSTHKLAHVGVQTITGPTPIL